MKGEGGVRAWPRVIDGRLYVTFPPGYPGEHWSRRTRRMTLWETLVWRFLKRVPSR